MGERLSVSKYRLAVSDYKEPSWKRPSIRFTIPRANRRDLRLDQPAACPLATAGPKRQLYVRLVVGAWPGVWRFFSVVVENRSSHRVDSCVVRFATRSPEYSSGIAIRPEGGLSPGGQHLCSIQEPNPGCVRVCVDFVQFQSGEVWCSTHQDALVTEASVQAGAKAAANSLLGVLGRSDAAMVMAGLTRIHADLMESRVDPAHGAMGFHAGVTSVAVRLQHVCERDALGDIENYLRAIQAGG